MPRRLLAVRPAVLVLLAAAACAGPAAEPSPSPAPAAPPAAASAPAGGALYTEAQADRGRQVFRARCSECHYTSEMSDDAFQFEWERRSVGDLLRHVSRTMPDDDPGSLTGAQYLDVIAYILSLNDFPAGPSELTADAPGLETPLRTPGS